MKIRIKAAVVLNAHESNVIANVLTRRGKVAIEASDQKEEQRVVEEFLVKRDELGKFLNR